jgi:hypothetical protein
MSDQDDLLEEKDFDNDMKYHEMMYIIETYQEYEFCDCNNNQSEIMGKIINTLNKIVDLLYSYKEINNKLKFNEDIYNTLLNVFSSKSIYKQENILFWKNYFNYLETILSKIKEITS